MFLSFCEWSSLLYVHLQAEQVLASYKLGISIGTVASCQSRTVQASLSEGGFLSFFPPPPNVPLLIFTLLFHDQNLSITPRFNRAAFLKGLLHSRCSSQCWKTCSVNHKQLPEQHDLQPNTPWPTLSFSKRQWRHQKSSPTKATEKTYCCRSSGAVGQQASLHSLILVSSMEALSGIYSVLWVLAQLANQSERHHSTIRRSVSSLRDSGLVTPYKNWEKDELAE